MFKAVLITGAGGFIGTILRFLVSRYFQIHSGTVFPWGTLVVNIAGCFLLGIIYGISEKSDILSSEWRLFLTVGICGGFTTFSTFSNDAFLLLQNKELFRFISYTGLSFFMGIFTVIMGRKIIYLF
jgi:fluoride exporter